VRKHWVTLSHVTRATGVPHEIRMGNACESPRLGMRGLTEPLFPLRLLRRSLITYPRDTVQNPYLLHPHRTGYPIRNHKVSVVFIILGTKKLWFPRNTIHTRDLLTGLLSIPKSKIQDPRNLEIDFQVRTDYFVWYQEIPMLVYRYAKIQEDRCCIPGNVTYVHDLPTWLIPGFLNSIPET
jgi:hypothetical protein